MQADFSGATYNFTVWTFILYCNHECMYLTIMRPCIYIHIIYVRMNVFTYAAVNCAVVGHGNNDCIQSLACLTTMCQELYHCTETHATVWTTVPRSLPRACTHSHKFLIQYLQVWDSHTVQVHFTNNIKKLSYCLVFTVGTGRQLAYFVYFYNYAIYPPLQYTPC